MGKRDTTVRKWLLRLGKQLVESKDIVDSFVSFYFIDFYVFGEPVRFIFNEEVSIKED